MDKFETILRNNNNKYSKLYIDLPEDLQYTIYNIIKNEMIKEKQKIHRHRLLKQIKRDISTLHKNIIGSHSGGAWELLFIKRNIWTTSDFNSDNLLNKSLSNSAIDFCRNEFIFNPL